MGIRFHCSECGHKMNVKAFLAGRKGLCPYCGASIRIPTESTRPASQPTDPPSPEREPRPTDPRSAASPGAEGGAVSTPVPASTPQALSGHGTPSPPAPSPPAASAATDPLAESPDAAWYVRPPAGGQYGPATGPVMQTWIDEGRVSPDCLVWREGWRDWQEARSVLPQLSADPGMPGPALIQTGAGSRGSSSPRHYRPHSKGGLGPMNVALILALVLAVIVLLAVFVWVVRGGLAEGTQIPRALPLASNSEAAPLLPAHGPDADSCRS